MKLCEEIGHWIEEKVVKPVERYMKRLEEVCEQVSRWIEETITEPLEKFAEKQEKRCKERECKRWCLCCNKWVCWFVTIVVKVIEWVTRVVTKWVIELVCKLVARLIKFIVMALITLMKWVVLAVICILEALCSALLIAAGLVLLALLLSLAALPIPVIPSPPLPVVIGGVGVAVAGLVLAKVLCRFSWCRIMRLIGWIFKIATLLSAVMAVGFLSISTGMVMAIYGATVAVIKIRMEKSECRLPPLFWNPWDDS